MRRVLYSGDTGYQKVEVLDSDIYGRSLVLDGKTQSTERDERLYHEALVHPAMLMHPEPRRVFIGGGGEGGTLRETLAHRTVERVVMIDLDKTVVDVCREYLPNHHRGSFDDRRLELRHQDARRYMAEATERFDVMIMDLVDPLEGGAAALLYTEEYYNMVKARLNPGGLMVTQSGPAGLLSCRECFTVIAKTLSRVFSHVVPSQVHIPAFQTLWGIIIASDSPLPAPDAERIDRLIPQRIDRELRAYDGESHLSMFYLPRFLREEMASETRINTDANPVFMV